MDYILDTNAAKAADQINSRIDEAGKYFGQFTRAEAVTSTKGTRGVDFSFKADSGSTADYLTLWTHNSDGKELHGFKVLMAIMTCLRVKGLKAENGEVEKYDRDANARVKSVVPLFKELMGKPIGLLIQMEEYEKNAGGTAWKPAISAAFDKDEFTAGEILGKALKPETLEKMVAQLRNRPLKATQASPTQHSSAPVGNGFAEFSDEIPF